MAASGAALPNFIRTCSPPLREGLRPEGPPRRRQMIIVTARQRSTGRATDEVDPPRDPFEATRRRRSPRQPRDPTAAADSRADAQQRFGQAYKQKEPFDAELLVLFGLPSLIILIPWVLKDPAALAVVPLLLLIPGPRDVLLSVLRDVFTGVTRASKFMKDKPSGREREEGWAPPPPPPPPGPVSLSIYSSSQLHLLEVEDII